MMSGLHPLLQRQLRKYFASPEHREKSWAALLQSIDEAYQQADTDRAMLERSLDLTSAELLEANALLRTLNQEREGPAGVRLRAHERRADVLAPNRT